MKPWEFDIIVLGSGFGGALVAMILSRQGKRVAVVDRLRHPRFAIGESSTPAADMIFRDLCDRYDLSSLAYQSSTAPDGERALPWIREINRLALRPDLTIVLQVPPEVAERRRGNRSGADEMFERGPLQQRLAALYARAADLVPGDRGRKSSPRSLGLARFVRRCRDGCSWCAPGTRGAGRFR